MSATADAIEVAAETPREEFVFSQPLVPARPRGRAFLISALGHCAFFFLLPHLASIKFFTDEPPVRLFVARVQSLNLKITEPLYAPPPPPRPRHNPAAAGSNNQKSTGAKVLDAPGPEPEGGSSTPAPEPAKPAPAARRFEMPPSPQKPSPSQPTILQPPEPSIGVPVQQLPRVIAWNDPVLPRPKPKAFVMTPGKREKAPEKPVDLTAPPTLDVASRSGAPAPINVGQAPALPRPRLAMPPSRTAPIRIADAPPPPPDLQGGEIAMGKGDPANLIILGTAGKPNEMVAVPPGSNVPHAAGEGGGAGSGTNGGGASRGAGTGAGIGPGAGAGSGAGAAAGSGTGAGTGSGSGTGTGASSGTGPGLGSGGASGKGGTNGAGSGTGSGAGSGTGSAGASGKGGTNGVGSGAGSGTGSGGAAGAPARRGQVKPGVFDIVVVQSAAAETQLRTFGILKGKPIYTVYLQLGLPKAWILQYCLPVRPASASAVSGVVRLDDPQPVTPPYPVATVLSEAELQPKSSYTFIHGFLTAAGKFRNMTLLGKVDQQLSRFVQLLDKWEFRPAMKGDTPAEVEVLLAIPPI